jgi:ankyrin repeat protein
MSLHDDAERGDLVAVCAAAPRLHLGSGVSVDLQDEHRRTALMLAVDSDKMEVVALLLERSAKVDLSNKNSHTALRFAAVRRWRTTMQRKVERSVRVRLGQTSSLGELEA